MKIARGHKVNQVSTIAHHNPICDQDIAHTNVLSVFYCMKMQWKKVQQTNQYCGHISIFKRILQHEKALKDSKTNVILWSYCDF